MEEYTPKLRQWLSLGLFFFLKKKTMCTFYSELI